MTVRRVLSALVLVAGTAAAADQQLFGTRLIVRDPTGNEPRRVVIVQGKERHSLLSLVGDPTASGASLQIVANGASGSTQLLTLDASGWTATASGFTYVGPSTGDPVRKVVLKRTTRGSAMLKATLTGQAGTTDLVVTPPNPGDEGGLVLAIGGGDRYCVTLGGVAGGTETADDATRWIIRDGTGKPGCPTSPSLTTTTTSSTTSSTVATFCGSTAPACNGSCPVDYHCETAEGTCFCIAGGSNGCTVCDPPCTGGQVCTGALDTTMGFFGFCGCVTPPVCDGVLLCSGSCPAGSTCRSLTPGSSCTCLAP